MKKKKLIACIVSGVIVVGGAGTAGGIALHNRNKMLDTMAEMQSQISELADAVTETETPTEPVTEPVTEPSSREPETVVVTVYVSQTEESTSESKTHPSVNAVTIPEPETAPPWFFY